VSLPPVLWFERVSTGTHDHHSPRSCLPYERLGFRPPRKGEHYVSGAIPCAYRAPNDLGSPFLIVRPLPRLRLVQ
jgi:hypothetical protein